MLERCGLLRRRARTVRWRCALIGRRSRSVRFLPTSDDDACAPGGGRQCERQIGRDPAESGQEARLDCGNPGGGGRRNKCVRVDDHRYRATDLGPAWRQRRGRICGTAARSGPATGTGRFGRSGRWSRVADTVGPDSQSRAADIDAAVDGEGNHDIGEHVGPDLPEGSARATFTVEPARHRVEHLVGQQGDGASRSTENRAMPSSRGVTCSCRSPCALARRSIAAPGSCLMTRRSTRVRSRDVVRAPALIPPSRSSSCSIARRVAGTSGAVARAMAMARPRSRRPLRQHCVVNGRSSMKPTASATRACAVIGDSRRAAPNSAAANRVACSATAQSHSGRPHTLVSPYRRATRSRSRRSMSRSRSRSGSPPDFDGVSKGACRPAEIADNTSPIGTATPGRASTAVTSSCATWAHPISRWSWPASATNVAAARRSSLRPSPSSSGDGPIWRRLARSPLPNPPRSVASDSGSRSTTAASSRIQPAVMSRPSRDATSEHPPRTPATRPPERSCRSEPSLITQD